MYGIESRESFVRNSKVKATTNLQNHLIIFVLSLYSFLEVVDALKHRIGINVMCARENQGMSLYWYATYSSNLSSKKR